MIGVPYKKEAIWKQTFTEGGVLKTQEEDGHLRAKRRGLEQIHPSWPSEDTNPADTLISDFLASGTVKKINLCCLPKYQPVVLCYSSPNKLINTMNPIHIAQHYSRHIKIQV